MPERERERERDENEEKRAPVVTRAEAPGIAAGSARAESRATPPASRNTLRNANRFTITIRAPLGNEAPLERRPPRESIDARPPHQIRSS